MTQSEKPAFIAYAVAGKGKGSFWTRIGSYGSGSQGVHSSGSNKAPKSIERYTSARRRRALLVSGLGSFTSDVDNVTYEHRENFGGGAFTTFGALRGAHWSSLVTPYLR